MQLEEMRFNTHTHTHRQHIKISSSYKDRQVDRDTPRERKNFTLYMLNV